MKCYIILDSRLQFLNVESVLPPSGGGRLVIFFGLVLPLKLQIELSGIHRSRKVYSAEPQGVRKSDFYSETKVFLSSVCVVIFLIVRRLVGFTQRLG